MRLPPWRHFSNYMHPHQGSDFPWIDIEYVLNTLELTANLALEIILGSTIRRIYSRDCQRSWECWMSSGWRLPCVSNDGWHTLYDPSTWDTASIPVCPPCIVYALYVDRILRPGRLALTCARHIVPLQCLVGRVRWADGRVHTMPLSRPYTGTAPILSGETKPLWTRPSGHGGHAQMWGAVSFDQSSTPESRGPRYFQGVLDIGSKQRRWEWWYNSSMTVENGDLNINMKTNLECIRDTLGTGNSKTTHLWQYWSTHIVRCYQVSMSLLILNAWCNEMCTKFSILLQVLFLSVWWTAATLSLMRFSRIWLNFLTAMDRVRGQWCVRQQWAGMLAEELL